MIAPESYLRAAPGFAAAILCAGMLAAVALVDYATGPDLNISILYLLPVFIAAWIFGSRGGVLAATCAALLWYLSIELQSRAHPAGAYKVWEAVIEFGAFALFGLAVAKLKTALGHADERFSTVLQGVPLAVYVLDAASGERLYANEPFHRTFAGGRPPALPGGRDEAEIHDPGLDRWFLVHARPLRWSDGRAARLHIATDITERRRAAELHRGQQEKLALTARLVAVGEMASTLAHELNQPLAAIANYNVGCARRLRSGDWDARELLDAVEKAAVQAERASSVVQRLREFVARRRPRLVACDVNDVVREVHSTIESEASKHSVELALSLSERIPYARGDPVLLEQVVLNLARNAIDAMAETPVLDRRLQISSREGPADTIEVEVADRGDGIAPELEANLFSPFFSTKPDGMGLGLHIARSIVEAHGGHIWATRNGERGMVFHFSLQSVYA